MRMEEWIDGRLMAPLNSVQKDDLTSSLFHFDHFKESLEVDAGESHDKRYCSKTAAGCHSSPNTLREPRPCTETARLESSCKLIGELWDFRVWGTHISEA